MASERSANCPGDNKPHHRHKKHKVGDCPPVGGHQYTKEWEDYWHRGHGSARDICVHTQGPDASQGVGWQDTYRCYLGSKPSKELVKKLKKTGSKSWFNSVDFAKVERFDPTTAETDVYKKWKKLSNDMIQQTPDNRNNPKCEEDSDLVLMHYL